MRCFFQGQTCGVLKEYTSLPLVIDVMKTGYLTGGSVRVDLQSNIFMALYMIHSSGLNVRVCGAGAKVIIHAHL